LQPNPNAPNSPQLPPADFNASGSPQLHSQGFGSPPPQPGTPLSDLDVFDSSQMPHTNSNSLNPFEVVQLNHSFGSAAAGSLTNIGESRGVWEYSPHDNELEDECEDEQGVDEEGMILDEEDRNPSPGIDSDSKDFHSKFTDRPPLIQYQASFISGTYYINTKRTI